MIIREIAWRSPVDAFTPLAGEPYAALLHAGDAARNPGWSVIAAFPSATLEARGGAAFIDGARSALSPLTALGELADQRRIENASEITWPDRLSLPPMMTGILGFLGYEMGVELEPSARGPASPFALPDLAIGAYDACATFDRTSERAFICARSPAACDRLAEALGGSRAPAPSLPAFSGVASNFSARGYVQAVAKAIELIRDGTIFQANLAQHLSAKSDGPVSPLSLFREVAAGDAPYAALLQYPEGAIVSNSPERFFKINPEGEAWRILAEPIKGTCARALDDVEDAAAAANLLADPKERAENIMIADLTRNDLSRVSKDGSIREDAICALESFSTVHHLVSRISGELREGIGAVDALMALFPCGSVTGAPKVEAMKTIAALEGVGRGPYCGAIGYIDDRGYTDFSVAIRILIVERSGAGSGEGARVTFPVGGGVTLRSDPQAEYRETLDKARASLKTLGLTGSALS